MTMIVSTAPRTTKGTAAERGNRPHGPHTDTLRGYGKKDKAGRQSSPPQAQQNRATRGRLDGVVVRNVDTGKPYTICRACLPKRSGPYLIDRDNVEPPAPINRGTKCHLCGRVIPCIALPPRAGPAPTSSAAITVRRWPPGRSKAHSGRIARKKRPSEALESTVKNPDDP